MAWELRIAVEEAEMKWAERGGKQPGGCLIRGFWSLVSLISLVHLVFGFFFFFGGGEGVWFLWVL